MKNFKIFAGTASFALAKKVAQKLSVGLGKAEIVRFADGECRARVEEELGREMVFVIQTLCPPVDENLIELCLLGDALKRNGAQKLVAIVPYLGYARQDIAHRKGECISASVVARIIEDVGFEKIITFDVHSSKALAFFKIPTENLSAFAALTEAVRLALGLSLKEQEKQKKEKLLDFAVVAPDTAAISRAKKLAKELGTTVVVIEKDRDLLTGKLKIKGVKGEIVGRKLVICDDMVTSGGTLILAAEFLKRQRAAKILACAVHPLLVKNAKQDLQMSVIEKVIVTDAIPVPNEKMFKKLEIVTVAPLIAQAIADSV